MRVYAQPQRHLFLQYYATFRHKVKKELAWASYCSGYRRKMAELFADKTPRPETYATSSHWYQRGYDDASAEIAETLDETSQRT